MDRLESLSSTLSQITLYDIKSMYNQAKNVVLNVTEMEGKVREATNDEPWGASSTLMQDIAQGTFNFQNFNEIMPSIYARFMEKEARQWRQIYKALQLLEYLIKNGSERVVDDARSHVSTLKMLRNFHYIDDKGKDEGLNVRNRSRELVDLLSDVEKIRAERRKAKSNKHKYTGTGNDGMGLSFSSGGSGRYGGFGSESMGGGGGGSYGGNGSFGGGGSGSYGGGGSYDRDWESGGLGGSSAFRDDARRGGFDEYNAGDDEIPASRRSNSISTNTRSNTISSTAAESRQSAPAAPAPAPAKEVDLLGGFLDDDFGGDGSALAAEKALPALNPPPPASIDDDEFADFQAAPIVPAVTQPNLVAGKPNLMDMLNSNTAARPALSSFNQVAHQSQPTIYGNNNSHNNFGTTSGNRMTYTPASVPAQQLFGGGAPIVPMSPPIKPTSPPLNSSTLTPATNPSKPSANFDDLWSMSLGGSGTGNAPAKPFGSAAASGGKSIKDLEKEKAMAGLWGSTGGAGRAQGMGAFGAFGGMGSGTSMGAAASSSSSTAAGGGDDFLL